MSEIYEDLSKEERTNAQLKALLKHFAKIDPKKKKLLMPIFERTSYCIVCIEDLEELIDEEGYTIETEVTYKNGQTATIIKQNDNVRTYLAMTKTLNMLYTKLASELPSNEPKPIVSRLELFKKGKFDTLKKS